MDSRDQRRTLPSGHGSHGVHVCHKCGWPFPNPHPSAKHRRAHKKICGTIEGYELFVSEEHTHSNDSDDERLSDDDHKTPGLNALDTGNSEKGSGGIGERSFRSEDEVFSDAVAEFSDGGQSPGVKDHLQDSLDSATQVETVNIEYPKFSGSSEDNGFDDCSLTSVAKETNLEGKHGIKPHRDMVQIVVRSDDYVGETCEGVSERAVSDVVTLDCQVADGAFNLKEENSVQVEGNANVFTIPACGDRPDAAHPQSEYEDFKDYEGVVSQNPLIVHSSELLKHEQDDLRHAVTAENNFLLHPSQSSEKSEVPSTEMHVLDSSMKKEHVNHEPVAKEMHVEESIEVSPFELTVESNQRLGEIGASMNAMKTEMNESHVVHFSKEQASDDLLKNAQQISLPEGSFIALLNKNPSDASFGYKTSETTSVISIDNLSHEKSRMEINDVAVDGECRVANVENDIGVRTKTCQPNDLLHLEVKQSDVYKSDAAGETGKIEKCDITDAQYKERSIVKDNPLPKSASSHFECPILSEVVMDESAMKSKGIDCTDRGLLSGDKEDIKDYEINSNSKVNEEHNRFVGSSADSHQARDTELSLGAAEDLARKTSLSSLNIEPSAGHVSAVEDNQYGEPVGVVSGITAVPVQDQSVNDPVKLRSGADTSVGSGSHCDSLEGNWGSVSVVSTQSDAQAVIDAEALPSTDLLASAEAAGKSNLNDPKAVPERQQSEKPEMFEPPSFMTLVEAGQVVGPELTSQQANSTSLQACWFPTLTEVTNDSQGRKKNEEIIAKVTNRIATKHQKPLKSLLGEAGDCNKPKSPKVEENAVNQKNGKVMEDNDSRLTTVNSILGRESPGAAQARKGECADVKRGKNKVKSRPYWIQLVCCSTADPQRS